MQKQDLPSLYLRFCAAASFPYIQEQKFRGQKALLQKESK